MRTRLIRIGNSRGIRLPKPLIDEAGLAEEVELTLHKGTVIIAPVTGVRSGWAEAAQRLRTQGEDGLLDPPTPTRFDDEEWEW